MAACTPSIHVFLGCLLFLLSSGTQTLFNFGITKFYNKFISSLYMFRAHVLIVSRTEIVLYSLWYHHTYRWP